MRRAGGLGRGVRWRGCGQGDLRTCCLRCGLAQGRIVETDQDGRPATSEQGHERNESSQFPHNDFPVEAEQTVKIIRTSYLSGASPGTAKASRSKGISQNGFLKNGFSKRLGLRKNGNKERVRNSRPFPLLAGGRARKTRRLCRHAF